jgi:hypothetical protein
MKPIDKKDQPKLFALIGIAVLALGFGAYQFSTASVAKPGGPKPGASPTPAAMAVQAQGADSSIWQPDPNVSIPIGGRDPFMPEGAGAPQPSPSPQPRTTPAPTKTASEPPSPPMPRPGSWGQKPVDIPPLGVMRVKVQPIAPSPAPTPTPPPPAPKLDLSGVLVADDDSRSKAIFKSGERSKILGVGDAAGNGWRIADIREGKVEIIDPKTGRRAAVELK